MTTPHRALIVIDAQREYFDGPLEIQYPPREQSLARIVEALDAAVQHGLPIVVVQHELPEGSPVFGTGSPGWQLHPELEQRVAPTFKRVTKQFGSVFADTGLSDWLRDNDVDTVTLVGFMTNNCVIASAAAAEPLGFAVEVLTDATGAIDLANEAGNVRAQQLHQALMVLLHSNFAATTTTTTWIEALESQEALRKDNLVNSAMQGRAVTV